MDFAAESFHTMNLVVQHSITRLLRFNQSKINDPGKAMAVAQHYINLMVWFHVQ